MDIDTDAPPEAVDVLIVGAGLSGIGAAWHLRRLCPDRRFAIVEARQALGGTWDLFRYPGVRSDSDMHTLGYSFRPWTDPRAIADGPTILRYLQDTAREAGIDREIRYGHRLVRADWSSADAAWTARLRRDDGSIVAVRCGFLYLCSGYYDYEAGHQPRFEGIDRYRGTLVHPQRWPEDLDYAGKRVVVIGSGATAVTLVPALAARAARVTMLQRSPTWMFSRPSTDATELRLRRWLPRRAALLATRWKNVLFGQYVYHYCRRNPQRMRQFLLAGVRAGLGSQEQVDAHFTPRYDPWTQRLCLVPDGDLFAAVRDGRAEVVTDHVQAFDETGIRLASGRHLAADIVVSATGLELTTFGKAELRVDGEHVDPSRALNYRGVMFAGVPNLANTFGYTNASWTLKADLTARFVCRLLNHMRRTGSRICVAPRPDGATLLPMVDFSSGYFQRALDRLPKQGAERPWKLNQNYLRDIAALRFAKVDDGVLRFSR